ncbi:GrpB family protein [Bradyrhizobium sp. LHD-71]|nr:GrpB family protein [Bradyrhizobium sp. LHD-71]MDQ8729451.1 GrpB family protein [Bradyrhizobium sp. LHD-71]
MDDIEIVAYDPNWPALFEHEATRLRAALNGEPITGLEHFGSTAIAGLAAKPIIDILIAVPTLAAARANFPAKLKVLDYVFWSDNPKADRLFFVKGMPPYGERRTHHVHVTEPAPDVSRLPARPPR